MADCDGGLDAAAGLLLSVGAPQRRSSRCEAARRVRTGAEEYSGSMSTATGRDANLSAAGATPVQHRHRRKQTPAPKDSADGCDADGEDDDGVWFAGAPATGSSQPQRKTPKSGGKAGRRPVSRQRTSRYMGVGASNRAGQWQARILVHGKVTHLGYYVAEEEAARAYDRVSLAVYGSAPTNFPASHYSAADIAQLQTLDRAALQQALGVKPMQKSSRFRGVSRKKGRWEAKVMVSRKWAYRELFNSEEAAARAYDAAVWQLKPYEVAKAYVNFKDECPMLPPGPQKAAKPSSKPTTSAGPQQFPAVPSLCTSSSEQRPHRVRCEPTPSAALALARASSSDHSLSGGAGGAGSDASRASSATRISAASGLVFGGSGGSYGSAGMAQRASAGASGADGVATGQHGSGGRLCDGGRTSPPSSPMCDTAGAVKQEQQELPALPGLALGWPSAPGLAHLAPGMSPHDGRELPHLMPHLQVHSASAVAPSGLPPGEWACASAAGTPIAEDVPMADVHPAAVLRQDDDLSPPPYHCAAAMQREGFTPGGTPDAVGMLGQTQAWSKDTQRPATPQVPQLPRAPLRSASTPHPLPPANNTTLVPTRVGGFAYGAMTQPGTPQGSPLKRVQTPSCFQKSSLSMQVPSPGHPAATTSPWGPSDSPEHGTPASSPFHQQRPLAVQPAPFTSSVMRSASTGALAGQTWMTQQPPHLPRSASFAGNPAVPLAMPSTSYTLHPGLTAEYCQDMLPELLSQQGFKQEPHQSPLRMGSVHIGGEEIIMFGGHSGCGDHGASEFEGMFDD